MFKQIILPLLLVAAFVAGVGIFVKNSKNIKLSIIPSPAATTTAGKIVKIDSTEMNVSIEIKVEIADTQDLRAKGLSGKSSLGENSGMLFIFDRQNTSPIFWMKDMLIPIDIIWINDTKIVKIDTNVQPPKVNTPDKDLATYVPGQPVDYVLEVNAGFSDSNNIKVGDSVDLARI